MKSCFRVVFLAIIIFVTLSMGACVAEKEPVPFPDWAKIDGTGVARVPFPFQKEFRHGVERWVLETEYPLKKQYVKVYWQDEAVAAFQVSGIGNTDINQKISFGGQEYIASEVHVNTDGLSGWVTLIENRN